MNINRERVIILTDSATNKIKEHVENEDSGMRALRISVQPGGCSGLRYSLFLDDERKDGDSVDDYGDFEIWVDKMSKPYLDGSTIDFVDSISQSGFKIDNPNARSSCACGDSFH